MDKRYEEKKEWFKRKKLEDPMFIEKNRERQRNYYYKNRDNPKFRERKNQLSRESYARLTISPHQKKRLEVFRILGDKCKICGFSDKRALQIDHIHNNGYKHYKNGSGTYGVYKHIIELGNEAYTEYQILCANCNWIKRDNNLCNSYKKPRILE
jgi:hypothetical protein